VSLFVVLDGSVLFEGESVFELESDLSLDSDFFSVDGDFPLSAEDFFA
jgi:hypothetical protein